MNYKLQIIIPLIMVALTSGCAHKYAVQSTFTYIGNNQYDISASGGSRATEGTVRTQFYRRAFKLCQAKNMGFVVISGDSKTTEKQRGGTFVGNNYVSFNARYASMNGVIECKGSLDQELAMEYAKPQEL